MTPPLLPLQLVVEGDCTTTPTNCPETTLSVALYDAVEAPPVKSSQTMSVLLLAQFGSVVGSVA